MKSHFLKHFQVFLILHFLLRELLSKEKQHCSSSGQASFWYYSWCLSLQFEFILRNFWLNLTIMIAFACTSWGPYLIIGYSRQIICQKDSAPYSLDGWLLKVSYCLALQARRFSHLFVCYFGSLIIFLKLWSLNHAVYWQMFQFH